MNAVLRISATILAIAACVAFVAGAAGLVNGLLALSEGRHREFLLACLGGVAGWFLVWLFGKGSRALRWMANKRAIASCAATLQTGRESAIALHNRGVALRDNRRFANAIAHFDAAVRLDPSVADPHVGRVNAYAAIGQWPRVIAEYTRAIQADSDNAVAFAARASAYNCLGRFDRSIPDATEAIRLAPNSYMGHNARGWGYLQRGRFNGGIKLLAIAWMMLSLGFLRRDRFDMRTPTGSAADLRQAIADFSEAIRLRPSAWDCYQGRSQAHRALGEHVQAAADEAAMFELGQTG